VVLGRISSCSRLCGLWPAVNMSLSAVLHARPDEGQTQLAVALSHAHIMVVSKYIVRELQFYQCWRGVTHGSEDVIYAIDMG